MYWPYDNNPGHNEVLTIRFASRVKQTLLRPVEKKKTTVIPFQQHREENLPLS